MIPFAVVGSDQEYQVNGRRLLGRKTKWGTIEGTDPPFPSLFHTLFFCLSPDFLIWCSLYSQYAYKWHKLSGNLKEVIQRRIASDLTESVGRQNTAPFCFPMVLWAVLAEASSRNSLSEEVCFVYLAPQAHMSHFRFQNTHCARVTM